MQIEIVDVGELDDAGLREHIEAVETRDGSAGTNTALGIGTDYDSALRDAMDVACGWTLRSLKVSMYGREPSTIEGRGRYVVTVTFKS